MRAPDDSIARLVPMTIRGNRRGRAQLVVLESFETQVEVRSSLFAFECERRLFRTHSARIRPKG